MLPAGRIVRTVDHPLTLGSPGTVRAVSGFEFRQATPEDARRLGRAVGDGFEGYRAFAPPAWRPPDMPDEVQKLEAMLRQPDVWCLMAETGGELAGHMAVIPAQLALVPHDDPLLAHVRLLFVEPPYWGSGLAKTLHDAGLEEAARRGFTAIRLFTPAGQARARRFYEREGWSAVGDPFDAPFGLPAIEYRRPLP
jgi:GNAT superfamily N-acetyltransferase